MLFSRIASFFTVFMTLSIFALGNPVVAEKRQVANASQTVEDIVNNLKSQTDTILPQIRE